MSLQIRKSLFADSDGYAEAYAFSDPENTSAFPFLGNNSSDDGSSILFDVFDLESAATAIHRLASGS